MRMVSLTLVENLRRFVAHVRNVHASHGAGYLRHLDHFIGRREISGDVEKARGHAERAVEHRLPHQDAHFFDLFGRGRAIHQLHHRAANRSLPGERAEIRGWMSAGHVG